MKTKHCVMGSILLFALMACALPGLSQPAALPTFDQNAIPTMVALTANASMAQTESAALPLATPNLAQTPLEQLSNGGTKYTDKEIGFEITFPAGWLTLRPNSEEFNSALANDAVKNDMLHDQMELDINDFEAGVDRLYSYPLRPDLEKNFAFGFSNVEWDANDITPVDQNSMGQLVRNLESSGAIPGFRADTAQIYENVGHINLIEVGGQFSLSDGQGGILPFYATFVFFKPNGSSTIRISFTYLKDYKVSIGPDVKSVIASIQLLGQ